MTQVKRISRNQMINYTGVDALGYAKPDKDVIYLRKDLEGKEAKNVLAHESEHIRKGEEGPFLGTAAIVGGSLISGYLGSQAARGQERASRAGIAEQRRMFDLMRSDTARQRELGDLSLQELYDQQGQGFEFDPNDPGYQFRLGESMRAINRGAAAQGHRRSGNVLAALQERAGGLATEEYGQQYGRFQDRLNRLGSIAQFGQEATRLSAGIGQNTASNIGNLLSQGANARANRYGAWNQAIQGGMGNLMSYNMLRPAGPYDNASGDAYQPARGMGY